MNPQSSSPRSLQPTTRPCPEHVQFRPRLHTLFYKIHFNKTLQFPYAPKATSFVLYCEQNVACVLHGPLTSSVTLFNDIRWSSTLLPSPCACIVLVRILFCNILNLCINCGDYLGWSEMRGWLRTSTETLRFGSSSAVWQWTLLWLPGQNISIDTLRSGNHKERTNDAEKETKYSVVTTLCGRPTY
jgi:hypothetical protein